MSKMLHLYAFKNICFQGLSVKGLRTINQRVNQKFVYKQRGTEQ